MYSRQDDREHGLKGPENPYDIALPTEKASVSAE